MLIVSWNVAALSTTVQRIDKQYGDPLKRRKDPSAVIGVFFQRHKADICCFQETKMGLGLLESRNEPLQCAHVDGYESFWSCCVDSSKRGFNGVVTYCKKGTVLSADSRPLKDPTLDDQGRCVMTDHGSFVLFNVYVPAGGGQPLSYKMKFLHALRRAMRNQRQNYNKEVILVGDLNICHREEDMYWGSRCLAINDICRQVQDGLSSQSVPVPKWKLDVSKTWRKIEEILKTKQTTSVTTNNPRTKEQFEKYRMMVHMDGKKILLGNHEEKSEYCESNFNFDPCYYKCSETGDQILSREKNIIAVTTVAELMGKLGKIEWDQNLQRSISSTDGVTNRVAPPRRWLDQTIGDDKMVDCFRHYYPNAKGRFTCWDQFKNRRYDNQGGRIDYTLIDKSLVGYLQKGEINSLRCGGCGDRHDSNSEVAALCAATANGRFQPVSFQGGGIVEASQKALDSQFGTPHTGHIYTPPSFSDHIGISVLLDDSLCSYSLGLSEQDKSTRSAQPHKKVRPINSYFSAVSSSKHNADKRQETKTTKGVSQSAVTKRKVQLSNVEKSTKVSYSNKKVRGINSFFSSDTSFRQSGTKRHETKATKLVSQNETVKKKGPIDSFLKSTAEVSSKDNSDKKSPRE